VVAQRCFQIANDGTRGANKIAELDKDKSVTLGELLVSALAQVDALAKLLIKKGCSMSAAPVNMKLEGGEVQAWRYVSGDQ
jgi:hypothetical protein